MRSPAACTGHWISSILAVNGKERTSNDKAERYFILKELCYIGFNPALMKIFLHLFGLFKERQPIHQFNRHQVSLQAWKGKYCPLTDHLHAKGSNTS